MSLNKWRDRATYPEPNRDIMLKVESPCDMGSVYVSGFYSEDEECYCETYSPANAPFDLIQGWCYLEEFLQEDKPTFEEGMWCAIQELVVKGADWVRCGEVVKDHFTEEQCINTQAKSGFENLIMEEFIRQEIVITKICEDCGKEYKETDFNRSAPYAMCDKCYDDYLCKL